MTNGTKERVGIVGCGRMGFSMLKHLIKKGYSTTVCDLSADALKRAADAGAKTAASPAELAKQCDFVILGVGYTDEVNAVVYGEDGLIENLAKGAIIAVSSTTSPYVVQEIAAAGKAKRHRRARRADLPRAFRGRRRHAAGAGRRRARRRGARPRRLWHVLLRLRASRQCRPRPGRQDHEQPAAVGERGRPDRSRTARGDHRHRPRETARRADDELRRVRRAQGVGHDLLHLGIEGHAGRRRDDRQGRALAADHRRDQGAGERSPPHQGEQSAELDRQGSDEISARLVPAEATAWPEREPGSRRDATRGGASHISNWLGLRRSRDARPETRESLKFPSGPSPWCRRRRTGSRR